MADALTGQERALIETALRSGRVTRIPRGASGLALPVWDADAGQLRYQDQGFARAQFNSGNARNAAMARARVASANKWASSPEAAAVRARRGRVAGLVARGFSTAQIAARLNISQDIVRKDAARQGLSIRGRPTRPAPDHVKARRDALLDMCQYVRTVPDVARVQSLCRRVVLEDLAVLGIVPKRLGRTCHIPADRPKVLARREQVAAMLAGDVSLEEIAEALDVPPEVARFDVQCVGGAAAFARVA